MSRKKLSSVLVGAGVLAAMIGLSAPASASEYRSFDLPLLTTGADGLGCAGDVWGIGQSYPQGDVPGQVSLQLKGWLKVFGVPAPWCELTPTVHWRNFTTGESGAVPVRLGNWQPFFWVAPKVGNIDHLYTGAGDVEISITTNYPHSPSVTRVTVY
ncbi:hypothetical protein [Nocardia altamirensis]|uniref:hypothetical protein n=1 Tax=Nocardia altamirensis TaxID=472158 RepID=UPI00114CFCCB|nr:hypothetical protein [Nocardia altamirensis]